MTLASKSSYEISRYYQHHELQRIENAIQPAEPLAVVTKLPIVESQR